MQAFGGAGPAWDAAIARLPSPHLLQTWDWAQVKAAYGWSPMPVLWTRALDCSLDYPAAAMVLKRQVLRRGFAARLCILYVPKGPLLDWGDEPLRTRVLDDLQALAKRERAIFLKFDPDIVVGRGAPGAPDAREERGGLAIRSELRTRGWVFANDQIQFRNTVLLDLTESEEVMLRRMKQKTRYNIRLAEKKGVTVRIGTSADVPALYKMYAETSARDGFVIRAESYYRTVWETFMKHTANGEEPSAEPLIAEVQGEAVAAILVFYFAGRAYYLYGMSRQAHREKMPNHLLQWEAIKRARSRGCRYYDLWGAPDEFVEKDPLWGVFQFKEGLGGEIVRTLGAWDYPSRPIWYKTYTGVIPKVLSLMRARGRRRTEQDLAAA
jgi:lipid II:glycine glycyltransferase (peptidoglycan interpeptide bridge formation enzyme)